MNTCDAYHFRDDRELERLATEIEREIEHLVDAGRKGLHDHTELARALHGIEREIKRREAQRHAQEAARQPDLPGLLV